MYVKQAHLDKQRARPAYTLDRYRFTILYTKAVLTSCAVIIQPLHTNLTRAKLWKDDSEQCGRRDDEVEGELRGSPYDLNRNYVKIGYISCQQLTNDKIL